MAQLYKMTLYVCDLEGNLSLDEIKTLIKQDALDGVIDLLDKMDENNEIYDNMDWKTEYETQTNAKNEFFKLFSEYFFSLWD